MVNQQIQESTAHYSHKKDVVMAGALTEIHNATEQCLEQAEEIIAEYWMWVAKSNKALKQAKSQAHSSGDTTGVKAKKMAYTGPRIEKMQSGSGSNKRVKPRIIWCFYPYSDMRLKSGTPKANSAVKFSQMGQRIKMTSNKEYSQSSLVRRSVGWDASKMLKTEMKLMPIRERLEALNKARVELSKVDKRINRITKLYVEQTYD
ncbi:MAG: hypothetical protein ACI9T7_000022 [Oleiphilaceae bacterium]|jgi:hypothetical protein